MSNIEEDVKTINHIISFYKDLDIINNKDKCNEIQALENILSERERDKKKIKELEQENRSKQKTYDDCYCEYKHYKQFDSIPVQKVNDEIEKYEYMLAETIHGEIQRYTPGEILLKIDTLKEILEDK